MAALTINDIAAKDANAILELGQVGEAVDTADAVYFNVSDSKWYKMDCSGTAVQSGSDGAGIALHKAQTDEYCQILRDGLAVVDTGGGITAGHTYVGGGTAAGDINPNTDADSNNWRKTVLFVAKSTSGSNTEIVFRPIVSETTA